MLIFFLRIIYFVKTREKQIKGKKWEVIAVLLNQGT